MSSTSAEKSAEPTPLMRQYHALKAQHPDALLFFRLGDFYELFFEDAKRAAPLLEVVLTQRQGTPMCGVPHHALSGYMAKLLKLGLRLAIAEQMQDPSSVKGMVPRAVVRVVSPGTVVEDELLNAKQNNFLAAVFAVKDKRGLALIDLSTGEFLLTQIPAEERALQNELARLDPRELLHPRSQTPVLSGGRTATALEDRFFAPEPAASALTRVFNVATLEGFGVGSQHPALPAAGAILRYVEENHPTAVAALQPPRVYHLGDYMQLDDLALRHLDILPSEKINGEPSRSLWDVLDRTVTPLGGRKLKWWLLHPLLNTPSIRRRQDRVEFYLERGAQRQAQRDILKDAADVERILGRLVSGGATGRDLNALRRTLRRLPELRRVFSDKPFLPTDVHPLKSLLEWLDVPASLSELLETSIAEEPPFRLSDGGVIRDGFSPALDELRQLAKNGRAWISEMEAAERQRTGIGSLKVGYTSVFGYYLEVSRANLAKAPAAWIRKQTLANAERFITPELKAQEDRILGADEKARALEAEIFSDVRRGVLEHRQTLQKMAEAVAEMDALAALAETADLRHYKRPKVSESATLHFEKARHPVVECALDRKTPFVPNDLSLNGDDRQILVITGPNMAGKSTFLRQTALLVVLAQMGSFVPAESAEVGVVDRIFTRIGAGDNLAGGASTFMVEMQEVANILNNATPRSLLILDEVGRGTSTFDGVAVAWAVIEHLHRKDGAIGPKTLFATHYFELTELAARWPGVKNFHAAVREWTRPDGHPELVFLHQVLEGPADRSYGVHVAQMAGLPRACVRRAREILETLESSSHRAEAAPKPASAPQQMEFFSVHPVVRELENLSPEQLTPLQALQILDRWAASVKNRDIPAGG